MVPTRVVEMAASMSDQSVDSNESKFHKCSEQNLLSHFIVSMSLFFSTYLCPSLVYCQLTPMLLWPYIVMFGQLQWVYIRTSTYVHVRTYLCTEFKTMKEYTTGANPVSSALLLPYTYVNVTEAMEQSKVPPMETSFLSTFAFHSLLGQTATVDWPGQQTGGLSWKNGPYSPNIWIHWN